MLVVNLLVENCVECVLAILVWTLSRGNDVFGLYVVKREAVLELHACVLSLKRAVLSKLADKVG